MNKVRVYDLPTRLFHWFFAVSFGTAFFIAKALDDDSAFYPFHMLIGMTMALAVILRVVWGLVGSRYARFSSFQLNPRSLIEYFKDIFSSKSKRTLGHNPASSWAAIIMMLLSLGLAVTGYLMANGSKETFEDIHELFANAFLVVAISHVAGVVFHCIRHRDQIGLSMIHGKKERVEGQEEINKTYGVAGIAFLTMIGIFVLYLNKNYDANNRSLNLFGTTLQLGENEEDEKNEHNEKGEHNNKDEHGNHDDDDD